MIMTKSFTWLGRKFLLGDEKLYGRLRLTLLVILPMIPPLLEQVILPILQLKWTILGPFLLDYLKLLVIYYLVPLK